LETKGEHLKGNDDTEYKSKLFKLLTVYIDTATRTGTFDFGDAALPITFTMLMEDTWQQGLIKSGIT